MGATTDTNSGSGKFLDESDSGDDQHNLLVLTIFGGSLVAVIVGYLLAWRFKRTLLRTITSMILAAVTGFVGLVMLWWLIGAVMPFPPPDGLSSIWEPLTFLVIFSVLPFSAFYISAKFIRLARKPANPR